MLFFSLSFVFCLYSWCSSRMPVFHIFVKSVYMCVCVSFSLCLAYKDLPFYKIFKKVLKPPIFPSRTFTLFFFFFYFRIFDPPRVFFFLFSRKLMKLNIRMRFGIIFVSNIFFIFFIYVYIYVLTEWYCSVYIFPLMMITNK